MSPEAAQVASRVGQDVSLSLIQYGAIGALLVIFLGVFLWVFYRGVNILLGQWVEQWKQITTFMQEQTKALQGLRESIHDSKREIISEFRAYHREPTNPRIPILPPPRRG
jgi:hypothetical protein